MWVVRCSGHIVKSMASDINTGKAPCSNTAAAIDCLSPLVAIRLCDSLETAQPMLNTTLAIHLTSKKVDAFASVTHRLIQGYRFRVGPYRFCGASNPTTHSILLWSYLILSDAHIMILSQTSPTNTPRWRMASNKPPGRAGACSCSWVHWVSRSWTSLKQYTFVQIEAEQLSQGRGTSI